MTRVRLYLAVQAGLCLLLVFLLSKSAVDIYREGSARKAEQPLEPIYTRERVAEKLAPITPLFFFAVGMTAAGLLLGVKEEKREKAVCNLKTGRASEPGHRSQPGRVQSADDAPRKMSEISAKKVGPGDRNRKTLQLVFSVAAIVLIVLGILNGSARDVLIKAINICTECIGLG